MMGYSKDTVSVRGVGFFRVSVQKARIFHDISQPNLELLSLLPCETIHFFLRGRRLQGHKVTVFVGFLLTCEGALEKC